MNDESVRCFIQGTSGQGSFLGWLPSWLDPARIADMRDLTCPCDFDDEERRVSRQPESVGGSRHAFTHRLLRTEGSWT